MEGNAQRDYTILFWWLVFQALSELKLINMMDGKSVY